MLRTIVREIDECDGKFALMMDGTTGGTTQHQISVVVRYLHQSKEVNERTIFFFNAKTTTGEGIYNSLISKLSSIGLKPCNIIGCSFDGGSNMSAHMNGVIAHIKSNDNENCFFVSCLSHRLNLCVKFSVDSSPRIQDILSLAENCAKIFRSSYKKMNVWIDVAKTTPGFNSQQRLQLIGKTRWNSKQHAITNIVDKGINFCVLINSLLKVCCLPNLENEDLNQTYSVISSWLRFDNVVIVFILNKVFASISVATKSLQRMNLNLLMGMNSLKICKSQLEICRRELDAMLKEAKEYVISTNVLLETYSSGNYCRISLPTNEEEEEEINREINFFLLNSFKSCKIKLISEFYRSFLHLRAFIAKYLASIH